MELTKIFNLKTILILDPFDNWNISWTNFEDHQDFKFVKKVWVHTGAHQVSISETYLWPRNGVHQDIQSLKQYLSWALLITGTHLGPILELTKILSFWKSLGTYWCLPVSITETYWSSPRYSISGTILVLDPFDNWNTSWAHIGAHQDFRFLKKKFGPILELTKFQYL